MIVPHRLNLSGGGALAWMAALAVAIAFGSSIPSRSMMPVAVLATAALTVLVLHRNLRWLVPLTTVGLVVGSSTLSFASPGLVFTGKFLLMGAVGGAAIPRLIDRRPGGRLPVGFAVAFLALVGMAFLSTAYSPLPAESFRHALSLLILWLAVAVGVPMALQDPSDVTVILRRVGFVAAAVVVAGAMLSVAGVVDGFQTGRFQGLLANPNTLGYFIAPILPALVVMVAHDHHRRWRAVMVLAVVALAVGLFLSGSRGGLLASAFGAGIGFAVSHQGRRVLAVVLMACAVTAVLMMSLEASVRPIAQNREGLFEVGTGSGRIVGWAEGVRLSSDRPLTGYGFATTPALFPEARTSRLFRQAGTAFGRLHNSYLEAAIDLGWPVAGLLAILGLSGAVAAWRFAREDSRFRPIGAMVLAGIAGGLMEGVFESGLLAPGGLLAFHFWLLVGAAHALRGLAPERTRAVG
jgi:hypothetical protein